MIGGAVGNLICLALLLVTLVLLLRVLVSWLAFLGARPPATGALRTAHDLLHDVTEPILRPLRAIVPPAGVMDLSMLVALAIIWVLRVALC
jgi:YggT family protein